MVTVKESLKRAFIIFNALGPYHRARLSKATAWCQAVGWDLTVIERVGAQVDYPWFGGSENEGLQVLRAYGTGEPVPSDRRSATRLIVLLNDVKPDVVVFGRNSPALYPVLRWCLQVGVPSVLLSDSTWHDRPRAGWKEWVKSRITKLYGSALTSGARGKEYLINLGMPEERIWTGYDVVDNEHFREGAQRARAKATFLREELDLPEHYFLTCARFIDVKNLTGLVLAYSQYVVDCGTQPWGLVLVGDGPLHGEIWALVQKLGLEELIRLPGHKDYEELPAYYGLADVFVLPSISDTWGLVVNEAMAAGLPVLVSEKCGCAPDLVREGVNGFTVDPEDIGRLASQMCNMALGSCDSTAMGRASEEIVSRWSLKTFAQGLHGAVECAGQTTSKKLGVLDSMILLALEPK